MTQPEARRQLATLSISNPWELAAACGAEAIAAHIDRIDAGNVAMTLDKPLEFRGMTFIRATARARHVDADFGHIPVAANIVFHTRSIDAGETMASIGTLTLLRN